MNTTTDTGMTIGMNGYNKNDAQSWKHHISGQQKKQIMNFIMQTFRRHTIFSAWSNMHIFHYTSRALLRFWDESNSKEEFLHKISVFSDVTQTPPPSLAAIQEYPMFLASLVASLPRQKVNSHITNGNTTFHPSVYWEKVKSLSNLRNIISPHLTLLERQCRELEQLNDLPLSAETIQQNRTKIQANITLGSYLIRLHREMVMTEEQRNELTLNYPPTERDYQALLSVEKFLVRGQQV
jgi:hypothetical protein